MDKKNLKNYGITLLILAAVFLLGIFSYWKLATWQVIDWATLVICGYIGYQLVKDQAENKQ